MNVDFAGVSVAVRDAYLEAQEIDCGHPGSTCIFGHPFFYVPGNKAELPGHIYSQAGMNEFRISKICEYCFDELTEQVDVDADDLIDEGEGLFA